MSTYRYKHVIESKNHSPNSSFHKKDGEINMVANIFDILTAGTDTTAVFLEYVALYLIAYPDKQEKIFQELDRELQGRKPVMSDKERLPYLMAFLAESTRYVT